MELLSVSSFIAALAGAVITLGVFLFLPRIKQLAATRQRVAIITAGLSVAIGIISLTSLQLANRSAQPPGDVTVVNPSVPINLPNVSGSIPRSSAPVEPKRITTVIPLSETLDAHPSLFNPTKRTFERRFTAQPGFKIVEAKFVEKSATRVDSFQVQTTDTEVIVRFQLISGPSVDRYRGWLRGDLVLVQEELRS
ncbi:MAG: hypothetical protein M9915_03400 [Rhizobacter sp.]|nr:hypothetical protein [Rhizobacter sp.]